MNHHTVTCRLAPELCDCALSLHDSHLLVLTFTNTNSHGSHAQKCYIVFIFHYKNYFCCVHDHCVVTFRAILSHEYSITVWSHIILRHIQYCNFMYEKIMEFWSKSPYVQKPLGKRDRWDGNVTMDLKKYILVCCGLDVPFLFPLSAITVLLSIL